MDQGSLKSKVHASIRAVVDEAFIEALDGTDNPTNRNIMRVLVIQSVFGTYALKGEDTQTFEQFSNPWRRSDNLFARECRALADNRTHVGGSSFRYVWGGHLHSTDRLEVFALWIKGADLADTTEQVLAKRKKLYRESIIEFINQLDDVEALQSWWEDAKNLKGSSC